MFTVATDLVLEGTPADPVVVAKELQANGWLEIIGGVYVLHEMLEAVPHSDNAVYYAEIVKEKSRLRRIIEHAHEVIKAANDPTADSEAIEEMAIRGSGGEGNAAGLSPVSFGELAKNNPKLSRPVIDGLLRVGEVLNLISARRSASPGSSTYWPCASFTGGSGWTRINVRSERCC